MNRHLSLKPLHRQQGIAAILIVILLSLALTATSFGVMHTVRNTQEQHVAAHATTHAQSGAWTMAEAFRLYLATHGHASLSTLVGQNVPVNVGMSQATDYVIFLESIQPDGAGNHHVAVQITNQDKAAQATATLGLTYLVASGTSTPSSPVSSLNFYDDLNVTGGIRIIAPSGTLPDLNVDGNVNIDQVNITELGDINATGNVSLGSGVNADNIYANTDVNIKDTVIVGKVSTLGNYSAGGSAYAAVVFANGSATINSSGRHPNVNVRGDINVNMGAHGSLTSGGDVTVTNAAGDIDSIRAQGDVSLGSWAAVGTVVAEGNLTACPGTTWQDTKYSDITVNGTVSNSCPSSPKIKAGANNSVFIIDPLDLFTINPMVVDVWAMRAKANYVFEYDTIAQRPAVRVYHINGQVDGTKFYIGRYATTMNDKNSFLCTAVDANNVCTAPATPELSACIGHSVQNACLSYNPTSQTWEFNGATAAPGIMWFDGNVVMSNGAYTTTILATGNVSTAGDLELFSANYSAYDEICLAQGQMLQAKSAQLPGLAALVPVFEARYKDYYPTNLCDKTTGSYQPIPEGNIGIAAGGIDPSTGSYAGGDIALGASNFIWGTVLAGNYLRTGGGTHVYGYVSAAVQGAPATTGDKNKLGASTVIDLTKATATYDPTDVGVPIGGGAGGATNPSGAASILWSRYL